MKKVAADLAQALDSVKSVPGVVLFCGFLVTREIQLLTLAPAFLLRPTYRSLRDA